MKQIDGNHSSKRKALRVIGPLFLLAGLGFMTVGLIDFFACFGNFRTPTLIWCLFAGMPLLFVGTVLTGYGFMGSVARYSAGEMAPVAKDTVNYMADGTRDSIQTVAAAIGEGLSEGLGNPDTSATKIRCPKCNHPADEESRFCPSCGASILKTIPCPQCSELNDGDARFCDNCGKALT